MRTNKLACRLSALLLSLTLFLLSPAVARAENAVDMSRFTDVMPGQWYYSAIEYVVTNGYFNGVTDTSFAPEQSMTRAMFVTVLGRMAGIENTVDETPAFSDVVPSSYYSGYVAWATENDIVQGVSDGFFSPNTPVTREQIAVFLYRYAKHIGMDVSVGQVASPHLFGDDDSIVSPWAMTAMVWANNRGIMKGTGSIMEPQEKVTRAQVAQMLYNFSQLINE